MPNVLANLFSWADGVKRRVSSPLQTIALGLQRGTEDLAAAGRDDDIAYGQNGMNSVLITAQQRAEAAQRSAEFGANMGLGAATVWHGSPHKFDKFDASKIGTGEGAQAYGHGLYFAESPSTAKFYQNQYGTPIVKERGRLIDPNSLDPTTPRGHALSQLQSQGGSVDEVIAGLMGRAKHGPEYKDAADWLRNNKSSVEFEHGAMYKVDLPDNAIAKMLDWDKPLSQQAPEVQGFARQVFEDPRRRQAGFPSVDWGQLTGADLMQAASPTWRGGAAGASKSAKDAGLPGVRYLDGGSRGAGQGSSNYVVFPGQEDILKILERNGVPTK